MPAIRDVMSAGALFCSGDDTAAEVAAPKAESHVYPGFAERMTGIEPAYSAWEADVLPLNYIRKRPPR